MKVFINFSNRTETVENVSVDDKCLPVVAGLHPYPSSSVGSDSPLVRESALWFKTLAVEAVYIDCDRRLIYWIPIVSNPDTTEVTLRKSVSVTVNTHEFIPESATPLFKDSSIYDFDASLKEMMAMCLDTARKFFKKLHTTDEFYKSIAKILHVYILPSITFTENNISCLTRAQCLIESRLEKSEREIGDKANSIESLRQCLSTLKGNISLREDLDSEKYLRTCKKDFLLAFLKTAESEVVNLNIELSTQQGKVNWAKEHPEDMCMLSELQQKRDMIFHDIDKCIRVREAIKNVVSRRDLTKRKVKKSEVVNSCFHNVFVEVVRRLEFEERILNHLGNDKVNICAAREAVVCTVLEMVSNKRDSDRTTKFEPEDFADFSVSENQQSIKSDVWLTFQERVARVLENTSSIASRTHRDGCRNLTSKINLALSEFHLTKKKTYQHPHHYHESTTGEENAQFHVNDVTVQNSKIGSEYSKRREAVLISKENESYSTSDLNNLEGVRKGQTFMTVKTNNEISTGQNLCERKAMSSSDISHNLPTNHLVYIDGYFDIVNDEGLRKYTSESSLDDILADENLSHDEDGEHLTAIKKTNLARERHIITRQLALGSLMNVIDSLKVQTRSHFQEIIACLGHELHRGNVDETLELEQQELLWKSYERFFCQEVYRNLMELYVTGLTPAIQKAYITLQKMSLHEILKEDKLLNLFFGDTQMDRQSLSIPVLSHSQSEDKFSMSRTLSSLSLDVRSCDIKELYTLANADCNDLRKRFNLDLIEYDDNDNTPSSGSLKSSELSNEDETFDMNSESLSTSAKSAMSGASIEKEVDSDTDKWKAPSDTERVEEIFKRILSPYKKLINRCLNAASLLDKVRYITKATEGLNNDISQMIGPDFHSACDDIISMLILALYNLPQDMFIGLYINLRLLMDLFPGFLSGTLWDFNLVTLCASYDYLFTLKVCDLVVRQYPGSFKIKR